MTRPVERRTVLGIGKAVALWVNVTLAILLLLLLAVLDVMAAGAAPQDFPDSGENAPSCQGLGLGVGTTFACTDPPSLTTWFAFPAPLCRHHPLPAITRNGTGSGSIE